MTVSNSHPHLPLGGVLIGTALASIIGAQVGWLIGAKAGPRIFDRPRSRLFDPHNVARAHRLLERFHYSIAIVVSRFVPVVRTFINPVCGVAEIPARAFLIWNVVGGILWTQLIVLLGRALGPKVHIDKYVLPIVAVIIVLSVIGILLEARKGGKRLKESDRAAAARPRTRRRPSITPEGAAQQAASCRAMSCPDQWGESVELSNGGAARPRTHPSRHRR